MTAIEEAITSIMELEVLADEWDIAPRLGIMIKDGEDFKYLDTALPDDVWAMAHPANVIETIAAVIDDRHMLPVHLKEVTPSSLAAVVFFSEGWGLRLDMKDPVKLAEARAYADSHRIEEHPDRVESKMASAVLDSGVFGVRFDRPIKGEPVKMEKGSEVGGRLFDALQVFDIAVRAAI